MVSSRCTSLARSQGGDAQCLGLAAGEDARAVGAGQDADLDADRPDGGRVATVDPDVLAQHQLAHGCLGEHVHQRRSRCRGGGGCPPADRPARCGCSSRARAGSRPRCRSRTASSRPARPSVRFDEQLGGGLRVRHGPMRGGVVPSEDEAHQVGQLVGAGIGVELIGQLQRVVHRARLPAGVVRQVAQDERHVECDVVRDQRRVADPLREARSGPRPRSARRLRRSSLMPWIWWPTIERPGLTSDSKRSTTSPSRTLRAAMSTM